MEQKKLLLLVVFLLLSTSVFSATIGASHYWDCNGNGCDSTILQPWNPSNYVSSSGYSPQNPVDHGGPLYGEKLWVLGAASDSLSKKLGVDDSCCGRDDNDGGVGGCGKCILVSTTDAVNSSWKVLVMKKNRCPPWSNGCNVDHMDFAVPGFDNLQYSTANICGNTKTGLTKSQSSVCGSWYTSGSNASSCYSKCDTLPANLRAGCKNFAAWGWKRGNPTLTYQIVACPTKFKEYVKKQFSSSGPTPTGMGNTLIPLTTSTATPTTKAPTTQSTVSGTCATISTLPSNEYYLQLEFTSELGAPSSVSLIKSVNGQLTTINLVRAWTSYVFTNSAISRIPTGTQVKIKATFGFGIVYTSWFSWKTNNSPTICKTNALEDDGLVLNEMDENQ